MFRKISLIFLFFSTAYAETMQQQALDITPEPEEKHQVCATCHGLNGQSQVPLWPNLAAQHAGYLEKQLRYFAQGEQGPRHNLQMYPWAISLSEQDRKELAQYYAKQEPVYLEAENQNDIELGKRIYHGGLLEQGVAACSSCHGPAGLGNASADFPKLSGQHAAYLAEQLKSFRSGKRQAVMMNNLAAKLTDEQITAVTNYIQGLRPKS